MLLLDDLARRPQDELLSYGYSLLLEAAALSGADQAAELLPGNLANDGRLLAINQMRPAKKVFPGARSKCST